MTQLTRVAESVAAHTSSFHIHSQNAKKGPEDLPVVKLTPRESRSGRVA